MAQQQHPVDVDPKALENAQTNWDGFVVLMKYSTIGVILVLVGMAFFLL